MGSTSHVDRQLLSILRRGLQPALSVIDPLHPKSYHWGRAVGGVSMNRRRLFRRLVGGSLNNVAFADLVDLVEGFGFGLVRVNGSHHIFAQPGIDELINLQRVGREAKPYQIRQFLRLVERNELRLED